MKFLFTVLILQISAAQAYAQASDTCTICKDPNHVAVFDTVMDKNDLSMTPEEMAMATQVLALTKKSSLHIRANEIADINNPDTASTPVSPEQVLAEHMEHDNQALGSVGLPDDETLNVIGFSTGPDGLHISIAPFAQKILPMPMNFRIAYNREDQRYILSKDHEANPNTENEKNQFLNKEVKNE